MSPGAMLSLPNYGMDHKRYDWAPLESRPAVRWPDGKPLAVWINLSLEHFPLNPRGDGFKAPGNMSMPYPDLRHYTLRDYGNRVGVFRVWQALQASGLNASVAVNGELAERYPALLRQVAATGAELVGHGWNMDSVHHGGMAQADEAALIARSLAALQPFSAAPITGWLSPARSQSAHTPDLLREAGITWCADWVNDELPYPQHTRSGALMCLPLSMELEDRFIVVDNGHAESEYAEQCIDACEFLLREARALGAGRLLALSIHPWVMGQPHRIKHLERVFAHLGNLAERQACIWNPMPSALLQAITP